MIALEIEKEYSAKDSKFQPSNKTILFDKFRISKFSCSCNSKIDNKIIIYLGMSNGNIITIGLYKQKNIFRKYEDITIYKCGEQFRHKGPVKVMICEFIENVPILFSGGYDGTIKLWQGDPELKEKDMVHHIKTLIEHKGTIMSLAFCKSRSLLISSSSDMCIKIFKMKDKFDKILNPRFECINVIKDFHISLNKDKDLPYWISTLSLKETDVIELFAGDSKGRIIFYDYIDENYLKYKDDNNNNNNKNLNDLSKLTKNNFNYIYSTNLHKKWGTIKVVHSIFDNVIYSIGFDNHIVCYNIKNKQKNFEIANSNSKSHFTALTINYYTQELIVGDDSGNVTFIKIFNKSEIKTKVMKEKIFSLQTINLFPEQEHILICSEENVILYRINRQAKISNIQHHDAEIFKLFVVEPVKFEEKIIEDAKVISTAYDNVIKIWDFLTMDCINLIHGPELAKKNVEISTICYCYDSSLIVVGTDIGNVFFWDLNKSEYLNNSYEKYFKHKNVVTNIITFYLYDKDKTTLKEFLISCSLDGMILVWEIQKTEIKQTKKKTTNYDEIDNFILKNMRNSNNLNKNNHHEITDNKYHQEMKNYKCLPGIKLVINSNNALKTELKFNCVAFQPNLKNKIIYAGVNDYYIYCWDFNKGTFIGKVKGNNTSVNSMTFDKNFLITSGSNGIIDIWNMNNIENEENILTLIISLKDPDLNVKESVRIHDILMLNNVGILVSCNNLNKINFWKYEKEELLFSISKEQETMCLAVVESYGKLLLGTKEKMIVEVDLAEQLNNINYPHSYEKYPFLKNEINYMENDKDKGIDNFKIMKILTNKNDFFK